jgi:hypothetical protein
VQKRVSSMRRIVTVHIALPKALRAIGKTMLAEFFDSGTVVQKVCDAIHDAERPVSNHMSRQRLSEHMACCLPRGDRPPLMGRSCACADHRPMAERHIHASNRISR